MATEAVQRRWRLAALLGLIVLLALAGFAVVAAEQSAQANRTVPVLRATQDIRAGTTITADELGVSNVRIDPAVLATLAGAGDRSHLVGEVATDSVRAGALIPTGLGIPAASAGLWEVPLPVKRMPADLKPGDHVALIVDATTKSGQTVDFVTMQDVRVLEVGSGSVTLWLPATAASQLQWYADHAGGIVLAKMPPGAVQQSLPAAGAS
jgi:Flp pilus assembly protein CpaB